MSICVFTREQLDDFVQDKSRNYLSKINDTLVIYYILFILFLSLTSIVLLSEYF